MRPIKDSPLQPALQRALIRALGEVHDQSRANLQLTAELIEYVTKLDARTSGLSAVAKVVDENEDKAHLERQIGAAKELISFTFREAHGYVVVVVAAGYAAYFATFSALSGRLKDGELYLSALLMTTSLAIFILWEVFAMTYLGWLSLTNKFGQMKEVPRWYKVVWPVVLALSLLTALPAIGLSGAAYLRGLQASPQPPQQITLVPSPADLQPQRLSKSKATHIVAPATAVHSVKD